MAGKMASNRRSILPIDELEVRFRATLLDIEECISYTSHAVQQNFSLQTCQHI